MQDTDVSYLRSIFRSIALVVLLGLTLGEFCFARPKKDVIQFANGDRITWKSSSSKKATYMSSSNTRMAPSRWTGRRSLASKARRVS